MTPLYTGLLILGVYLVVWKGSCHDTYTQPVGCFPHTVTSKTISVDELGETVASFRESGSFDRYYNKTSNALDPFSKEIRAQCGLRAVVGSIISGKVATRRAWPWQALIVIEVSDETYFCGGTLISNQWLITAAHCFHGHVTRVTVFLGAPDLREFNPSIQKIVHPGKRNIYLHPEYDLKKDFSADVALVKFPKPLAFTKYIKPACLGDAPERMPRLCLSMGWGRTTTDAKNPKVSYILKQIVIKVRSCFGNPQFYCGWTTENKQSGVCLGDSGGPLLCAHDGVFYVSGIVSNADGECDQRLDRSPAYYTNISHHLGWIKKVVQV